MEQETDTVVEKGAVIIAGNGRFGPIIHRPLAPSDIPTVVLDHAASILDMLRQVDIHSR